MRLRVVAAVLFTLVSASVSAGEVHTAWIINGKKIYPAPDAQPIEDGAILLERGKIAAVARASALTVPSGTRVSECSGPVVVAGFQNSHVHFIESKWENAARQPAESLSRALTEMLTRYGYTTVLDTASDLENTVALRNRIEQGELRGPRILTVGLAMFPPNGIPIYIRDLPKSLLDKLPQPRTAADARRAVQWGLEHGADATKLFLATPQGRGIIARMPLEVAEAAADETHKHGKLIVAHPTDLAGIRTGLRAAVDVMVHTTLGERAPWDAALLQQMVNGHVSVVPTFKLWSYELKKDNVPQETITRLVADTLEELRAFKAAGGQILFGTDVGYMHDYDPTDEYALMAQAGLTPMQILATLTTEPAARWNEGKRRGRIEKGFDADLVVLDEDPADDPRNFAKVRCALRAGQIVYSAQNRQ